MGTVREILAARLAAAVAPWDADEPPDVAPTADARFGDYQSNAALLAGKRRGQPPRKVAEEIVARLDITDVCEDVSIAGPGFINFRIGTEFLTSQVCGLLGAGDPTISPASPPRRIVVDFSAPNVAKPMHVGHIRSTILGDCLARVARFLGHEVVTDNHIGDWGTQFGKVIYGWKHFLSANTLATDPIAELVRLYREVNRLEETDSAVAQEVRAELVRLQQGDPENLAIWRQAVEASWVAFQKLYDLLGIRFDERLGESFYNDALGPLCDRLERDGLARLSEGALCVFFPDIPALAEKPTIIRKGDGGFLYATTDLATIEYRVSRWDPDAIWYVVGAPQALHFQQVFAAARRMGIRSDLEHIPFGSILGEDRKIMRTRSGENVGLADLLHEGIDRARRIVTEKNPDLAEDERESIARAIGLGAVKYAELSQNRMTDYVFSWDKMLAFQGNTAPYLQNAHVRIRSIFRKLDAPFDPPTAITLNAPAERALALKVLQFAETVPLVLDGFRPNLLANFLYELAITFHGFYEACPILKAPEPDRSTRLALCDLTARTLRTGLALLGIDCPERM